MPGSGVRGNNADSFQQQSHCWAGLSRVDWGDCISHIHFLPLLLLRCGSTQALSMSDRRPQGRPADATTLLLQLPHFNQARMRAIFVCVVKPLCAPCVCPLHHIVCCLKGGRVGRDC